MRGDEDRYSRVVGWLKIILPLIALGILSTLFLLSQSRDPERAIPYSDVDVRELARESRIGRPAFSGVTKDGTTFSVAASAARPDPEREGLIRAEGVEASLEIRGGLLTDITARAGSVDTDSDTLSLTGDVRISTSTGYRIATERLDLGLDVTWMESPQTVTAAAPFGTLTAGRLRLRPEGCGGPYSGIRPRRSPELRSTARPGVRMKPLRLPLLPRHRRARPRAGHGRSTWGASGRIPPRPSR